MKIIFIFTLSICVFAYKVKAQVEEPDFYNLKIVTSAEDALVLDDYLTRRIFFDTTDLKNSLEKSIQKIRKSGYLLASFDYETSVKDTVIVDFYLGKLYKDFIVDISNLKPFKFPFLTKKDYIKSSWPIEKVNNLELKILEYSENYGFPFAKTLLNPSLNDDTINLVLNYEKGALVLFDSINFTRDSINLKESFFLRKVGISNSEVFSQTVIETASKSLDKLPYLELTEEPSISFEDDKANLLFNISKEKANEIDGVLGFFPRQGNRGGLQLAGNFNLHLHNLFSSGKELQLSWQRFQNQSQVLNALYNHPYLFGTSIDVGFEFRLLQQDTTFSSAQRTLLFGYDLKNKGYLQLFGEWLAHQIGSNVTLSENEENIISGRYLSYGLKYNFNNIEQLSTFSKGYVVELKMQVGNKQIDEDTTTNIQASSGIQTVVSILLAKHLRIGKRNTLKMKNAFSLLASQNRFRNEYFRIGGLQTLRGFNENAIFSSTHSITSVEFLSQYNSISIFPFIDYARWQEGGSGLPEYAIGTGVGFNLATQNGVFSIIYALGSRKNQPFAVNEAKIHFGFANKF